MIRSMTAYDSAETIGPTGMLHCVPQINNAMLSRLSELNLDMVTRFPGMQLQFTELVRFPGVMQQADMGPEAQQGALFDVLTAYRVR